MRFAAAAFTPLLLCTAAAHADDAATVRALIQRDQQSAEFAAEAQRGALEQLHADQLLRATVSPGPDQRAQAAKEREALLLRQAHPTPAPRAAAPLPLPGGPAHGVDPIPAHRFGG